MSDLSQPPLSLVPLTEPLADGLRSTASAPTRHEPYAWPTPALGSYPSPACAIEPEPCEIEGLNGKIMQDANTSDMVFGVARTIALLSQCLTLEPGDVLVMGTPGGVGYARTPPVWMKAGDTIDISIQGIGVLSNPVTA